MKLQSLNKISRISKTAPLLLFVAALLSLQPVHVKAQNLQVNVYNLGSISATNTAVALNLTPGTLDVFPSGYWFSGSTTTPSTLPPGGEGVASFGPVWPKVIPAFFAGISDGMTYIGPITTLPPNSLGPPIVFIYPDGAPDDNNDGGCNSPGSGCASCGNTTGGMPTWQVSEPYVSLWLRDEPLGYQPAVGPRVSFNLAFKQRESISGINTNLFSVGKKWNCAWFSYVREDVNTNCVVYFPGGRQRTFYTTNDYQTNTRITGDTTNGFTMFYPDGSQNVYGFVVTNSGGAFQYAFLTQQSNPQGQTTTLDYYPYTPTNPVIRLQYVVDGDSRTNFVYYATNNAYSTNLISQVTDPFGRMVSLAYDGNGHMTNITDVSGISSSISYDTNDWVSSLATPYGTTGFSITDASGTNAPNGRSVLITQPDGGHQLYLFTNNAPGISNTYPSSAIPNTAPFSNTLDTNNLNVRDTFYWGPLQYTNLSTTNISAFNSNDFLKGRMRHWLRGTISSVGDTLSMERDPSSDAGGSVEGQKTWYDYAGKTSMDYEGTQVQPLFVAMVLPDGSTRFTQSLRNSLGTVTNEISTYSAGGGIAFRTNIYVYDPNGIDLLITTNALGVQVSSNMYNAYHEVATNYDALNEMTVYTYNTNQQLTSVTLPSSLVTTYVYGSDNSLTQQINVNFSTNNYTYTNDLVLTHTDVRGLTTTNAWDNLNRLIRTTFPDGTSISYTYSNLDLIQVVDRMGFINSFVYDNMRRKIAETNALGAVTIYNYCSCGSLVSIIDAASNITQFSYDNQGNLTNILYPDYYSLTRNYNLLKQVVSTSDSGGNNVTNTYNNQGLLTTVSNVFGQVQGTSYDILDRTTNAIDANGVSVATTYDDLNRPVNRNYPDNGVEYWSYTPNVSGPTSYTNQVGDVVTNAYDDLSRKINEVYVGVTTNTFVYDGAGDMLTLIDGKSQTTSWLYDQYGNVTNKLDANNTNLFVYQYDADNRLTNRWSAAKGTTVYRYDAVGNLTNVDYSGGTVTMPSVYLAYDLLNRLTSMVTTGTFTNSYAYDSVGQLTNDDGPWANDTVSYTYANRLRTGLNLSQPSGSWSQSYGYDSARRLTSATSPAGTFGYVYGAPSAASALVDGITLPNGANITNTFDSVARLLSTKLLNSSSSILDSESYAYNQAGQRTVETNTTGDFRNYTYDNEGELKTAIGKESGSTTNRWQEQLGYAYDAAGNLNFRTNNTLLQNFNVNNLNELTTETNGGTLTVVGTTTSPATNVTVNTSNAVLYADSTFASTNQPWVSGSNTFTAIAQDSYGRAGTNTVIVNLQATNNYSYDLNGNLTSDGNRNFAYDDENQLTSVYVTNVWRNDFVYDGKMRRRIERDYIWTGSWAQTNETHFIYDGNVVIQERDANNNPLVTYTRGNDLSGAFQGAGGIGGLLARTDNGQEIPGSPTTAYYHADGNGNVTMLIYTNQLIGAKYLYDPYGNTLSLSGPLASLNVYRFSSKEWNNNAGLYYYLYRFYDPNLQRWPNRDSMTEPGFETLSTDISFQLPVKIFGDVADDLYVFTRNNSINHTDPYGLCPISNPPNPSCSHFQSQWPDLAKLSKFFFWYPGAKQAICRFSLTVCQQDCASQYGPAAAKPSDSNPNCYKKCNGDCMSHYITCE